MIYERGDLDYESHRLKYVNGKVPSRYPREIHVPENVAGVVQAVGRARQMGAPIGVRSGGHLFPCTSLLENGILVDMSNVNRKVSYDSQTHMVDFGPAVRVAEAMEELQRLGRFLPTGHDPSVALGGFCLAGGQGWFMRGWGATTEKWVTQLEIVLADGDVVIANSEQNADLFWAARGSGQWFFGILTRIWSQTIPSRKLFHRTLSFRVEHFYEQLLAYAFDRNRKTPKWCTESAVCTFYPAKYDPAAEGDAITDQSLWLTMEITAYADTLDEAETMLMAWSEVPTILKPLVVQDDPVRPTSWNEIFALQREFVPWGNGERWLCDSILSDPALDEAKIINAIKPAMCDLPTRTSVGCIYIGDTYPDVTQQSFSLPQQYYIASFVSTKEPAKDTEMKQWLLTAYKIAEKVACGMYIADYDYTYRKTKVMTTEAFDRWLLVKKQYDPENRFPCSEQ